MVTWKLKASTYVPAFNVGGSPHAVVERRHRSPMANSSSKKPQTLSVHSETSGVLSAARFVPNPVHAELRPVVASANKRGRPTVAAASANPPEPISADVPASSTAPEPTAPSNNTGWSTGDVK